MRNRTLLARTILAWTLGVYIVLCILIAGLNYGVAPTAPESVSTTIHNIYKFYENEFKVFIIILCACLTFIAEKNGKRERMRRANVIGLCVAALLVHVILPLILHNREIYYVLMPLPWSTTGLQLLDATSSFYEKKNILWGAAGISATIIVFISVNTVVFVGTLLFGRRLQCSTLCLMNGFVAEIWSPVLPLAGKRRKKENKPGKRARFLLLIARIVMFAISSLFTIWWILKVSGLGVPGSSYVTIIASVESFKYLTLELLMAMFFWVVWSGRGYCHYCPAGTALSILAKIAGQKIRTDCGVCTGCGLCSKACPLSIDVSASAKAHKNVTSISCVGCGHCIDACPAGVLKYETHFLRSINKP